MGWQGERQRSWQLWKMSSPSWLPLFFRTEEEKFFLSYNNSALTPILPSWSSSPPYLYTNKDKNSTEERNYTVFPPWINIFFLGLGESPNFSQLILISARDKVFNLFISLYIGEVLSFVLVFPFLPPPSPATTPRNLWLLSPVWNYFQEVSRFQLNGGAR